MTNKLVSPSTNGNRLLHEPVWAKIIDKKMAADNVETLVLQFEEERDQKKYSFEPGQFNMLYVPGYGEVAISISSDPDHTDTLAHTIRYVGNVTNAIKRLEVGDTIGVRGPFGNHWPIDEYKGSNIVLTAGGIGLAPLRPVIYHIINNREDYGEVVILYGARSPQDLLFTDEYEEWEKADIKLLTTVDRGDDSWTGQVGVVPMLFYHCRIASDNAVVFSCGPEIMMRFVVFEGLARRIPRDRIYLSMERNMKCGQGYCGHCQIGGSFVCKEGPVYTFRQLEPYFNVEEL